MNEPRPDRPLPPGVRRDLDRAAAGIGRAPTTAHPDCTCTDRGDPDPVVVKARRAACPQHRPEPR